MKIKKDMLQIGSGFTDKDGTKLAPEAQPVRRVVTIDAPVSLKGPHGVTETGKGIPTEIVTDNRNAVDVARGFQYLCGNCKWFRNKEWLRDLANADSPMASMVQRKMVNEIRGALLSTQNANLTELHSGQDGDLDVEAALKTLGYCKALFHFFKNKGESDEDSLVLLHPISSCPTDIRNANPPMGMFEPKDNEARKVATQNYDRVMQKAAGKTP